MKKPTRDSRSADAAPTQADEADFLHRLLQEAHKPLRLDAILRMSHAPRHRKKNIEAALGQLAHEGKALRMRGGLWMAASLVRTLTGRYSVLRSGAGFVTPRADEPERGAKRRSRELSEDVFITPEQAGEAWHGDLVTVALLPGRSGKSPEGRIVEVLERGQKDIAVRIMPDRRGVVGTGLCMGKPADPRFTFLMQVDVSALPRRPSSGELVLVSPGERLASNLWKGTALASFGREDDVAVQEQLVKLNHQVPMEFPQAVLDQADALPPEPSEADMAGREDLRDIPFVTIDGRTARDYDDAVHVEKRGAGWLLRVAIADVTHYMRPRSLLDEEAKERGNSWYFPRSVEPMLPPALSNGLCSLNPDVDRLVMLAEVSLDERGEPGATRFAAGVLRSAARLTYGQVKRAILDEDAQELAQMHGLRRGGEVVPMLREAVRLARVLAERRRERGSLDFSLPEPEYYFDEEGRIIDIRCKEHNFAHQLIEEFMITANEAVARFLEEKGLPFLYRVHPEPDPVRLEGLFRTLASTSLATHLPARPDASSLQGVLRAARGGPQEFLVGRLTLRTMPQARYQPENEGHFGLASACYCHFTSPIRRYADVVVHRALKRALSLDSGPIPTAHKLVMLGDQLNRRERAAMEAEREMARRLATLVLRDRVGQDFPGVIAGVSDFGLFVELDAMPVEGMVRVDSLGDDYFEYDPERQELTGVMSGVRFYLGQRVRTRLVEVNAGRLEITLALLELPPAEGRSGQRRGADPRTGRARNGRDAAPRRDARARPGSRPGGRKGGRTGGQPGSKPGGKKSGSRSSGRASGRSGGRKG